MQNVEDLLEPLHLLAHTSKIEISLTKDGGVAKRSDAFGKNGIMGQLKRNAAAVALAKAKTEKQSDEGNSVSALRMSNKNKPSVHSFKTGVEVNILC